jgi:hypothetical protein
MIFGGGPDGTIARGADAAAGRALRAAGDAADVEALEAAADAGAA